MKRESGVWPIHHSVRISGVDSRDGTGKAITSPGMRNYAAVRWTQPYAKSEIRPSRSASELLLACDSGISLPPGLQGNVHGEARKHCAHQPALGRQPRRVGPEERGNRTGCKGNEAIH